MDALSQSVLGTVDEKGFVPDDTRNAFFRKLRIKNDNRTCFECPARNPTWISLSYGVYLCLECSGEHRRKGVHISFVRSVELDRFTPEQMVQMACGGNGKALEYFKQHEMGKTSSSARSVDYTSKISVRYKQTLDALTKETCTQHSVASKATSQSAAAALVLAPDPVDEATDFSPPLVTAALAAAPLARGVSAPATVASKLMSAPADSVVVRKSAPETPTAAAKPATSFGSSKQLAKEIQFDFDFDDLEAEASKPRPAAPPPAPKAQAFTPKNAPSPSSTPLARASSDPSGGSGASKFGSAKAISSEDYFGRIESETASARYERENRYQKFAQAGAISSSSFFGEAEPGGNNNMNEELDDWKQLAGRGANLARQGMSKAGDIFTEYLNKVRE